MTVTWQMYAIVCPLVFLAATVDAIGGGGGLISLPAYLMAGLDPVTASGSNKLSASFGSLMASVKYLRSGKLLWKPSLMAVLGALPGAFAGAELLKRVPEDFARKFMLFAIPVVAVMLLIKREFPARSREMTWKRLAVCFLIGLGCGVYDGFFGPGAGTLMILGLSWCAGLDAVTASGSAKVVNLASNVGALSSMIAGGRVLYSLAAPAILCSLAGGYLGSYLAIRKGARLIRFVMLGVLALLMARLAAEYFGG